MKSYKAFQRALRACAIVLIAAALGFGGCSAIQGDDDDDNFGLLLLLGAAALSSGSTCQNNSGLVICIPPGLRF